MSLNMQSLWQAECKFPELKPLKENQSVDIAVIGAGMAGILTAYFLQERGYKVVVLDRARLGEGETGGTTAKITAQHRLIYDNLLNQYGDNIAWQYALANSRAIRQYQTLIAKLNIDCHFKHCPAYVYTRGSTEKLEKENEAAVRLGIPSFMTDHTELPFKVTGALCFSDQARFHPLLFLRAIAEKLTIYENTRVRTVEDGKVYYDGGRLSAKWVVIATHYPLINYPGLYFMRMHQSRSYVQALKGVPEMSGMYINQKDSGLSFRSEGDILLLGGAGHRTGKNPAASEAPNNYEILKCAANRLYPEAKPIYSWSAQDCMTSDGVPYIGSYSASTPRLLVATGFNKWGMTSSMVAATLLTDKITGAGNECMPAFSPKRFSIKSISGNFVNDGLQSTKGLLSQAFHFPVKGLDELPKGAGDIVEYKGKKVGAYKSENGEVFLVSTRCPHLGCELKWNPDELSWDCPCHGSRFDINGKWISSPAVDNLPKQHINTNLK
ncbi:MAG: FAD-dependent oxidoreductase [Oscillospiraceae bacterium]|nr:FAD-dependent oxidoreductase [Oscillospiraceae bacterium]MDD4412974.1 FAD-dependent oxidoreductase [Oscillospiraceae bacterium]